MIQGIQRGGGFSLFQLVEYIPGGNTAPLRGGFLGSAPFPTEPFQISDGRFRSMVDLPFWGMDALKWGNPARCGFQSLQLPGQAQGNPRCSSGVKRTPSNNIRISQSPAGVKSTPSFCARRRYSAPGSAGRRRRHGRDRKTSIRAVMSGPAGAQHHYQAAHFPGQLGLCRCLSPGTGGGLPAVELLVLHLVSLRCQQPGPPDLDRIASAQRSGDRSHRCWDLQSTADA